MYNFNFLKLDVDVFVESSHFSRYLLFQNWLSLAPLHTGQEGPIINEILSVCNRGDTFKSIKAGPRQGSLAKTYRIVASTNMCYYS